MFPAGTNSKTVPLHILHSPNARKPPLTYGWAAALANLGSAHHLPSEVDNSGYAQQAVPADTFITGAFCLFATHDGELLFQARNLSQADNLRQIVNDEAHHLVTARDGAARAVAVFILAELIVDRCGPNNIFGRPRLPTHRRRLPRRSLRGSRLDPRRCPTAEDRCRQAVALARESR